MTVANIITMLRIVLVPLIVWALLNGAYPLAFAIFLIAGLSDAVDGTIARFFDQRSDLGRILDPIADKFLMVLVYLALAWTGNLPQWLVVIVVGRDVCLTLGAALAWSLGRPIRIQPLFVSKVTTAAQIVLALLVLFELAFGTRYEWFESTMIYCVAGLTISSALAYLVQHGRVLVNPELAGSAAGEARSIDPARNKM